MKYSQFLITLVAILALAVPVTAVPFLTDIPWVSAGGCWTYTDGTYSYVMWNSTGNYSWNPQGVTTGEYVMTGAGASGGGKFYAGGGGAAAVRNGTLTIPEGTTALNITIGDGGDPVSTSANGINGTASILYNITANGGERGYTGLGTGVNGDYQGGAAASGPNGAGGGHGSPNSGFNGGNGGGALNNGTPGLTEPNEGQGAPGLCFKSYILGSPPMNLSEGGTGGAFEATDGYQSALSRCLIGGRGARYNYVPATNGTDGTGSGGGGAGYSTNMSGSGGSGLVVFKYLPVSGIPTARFASTNITATTVNSSTVYEGYAPFTMRFLNTTSVANNITSFVWNATPVSTGVPFTFNDTSFNPVYTFASPGNYSIQLNVSGTGGNNISTQVAWVNVLVQPHVQNTFTATNTTVQLPPGVTNFSAISSVFPADQWAWDFGDSTTGSGVNPTHIYSSPGMYTVRLTSSRTDNATNTNTTSRVNYINVTYNPYYVQANFSATPLSGAPGLLVSFIDMTSTGNASATKTCNWSFGDSLSATPYSSTCGNVQHVYSYAGVYDVNLSVTMFGNTSYMFKSQYITVSTGQNSNIVWTPSAVAIQILDANYNPIKGVPFRMSAYNTSLPGGLAGAVTYFKDTYGVTLTTAQEMFNANTSYEGTTDDYGFISTQVVAIIQYRVVTRDSNGIPVVRYMWPSGPYYQIVTENATVSGIAAQGQTQNSIYKNSTFNTTFWEPNTTHSCMGINVYDSTGQTTNVSAWWTLIDNGSVWYENSTFIGGYGPVNSTKCVQHVPYQRWKWGGTTD
jgi:PKD repeat protein